MARKCMGYAVEYSSIPDTLEIALYAIYMHICILVAKELLIKFYKFVPNLALDEVKLLHIHIYVHNRDILSTMLLMYMCLDKAKHPTIMSQ